MNIYLDIETSYGGDVTIIGIYRCDKGIRQIVSPSYGDTEFINLTQGVSRVYTYNGNSFDLPVIKKKLGIDLKEICESIDLRYLCNKKKLFGGLKKVERILGIKRETDDVDGREAMALWQRYSDYGSFGALNKLLRYNKEDVLNLIVLRRKLKKIYLEKV